MKLRILLIEDDDKLRSNLQKSLDNEVLADCEISVSETGKFEQGIKLLNESDFDIVILDLFKDKDTKDEEAGKKVLDEIRRNIFVPVIFYTGHAHKITDLRSEVVGVVSKGDGLVVLMSEIERIIKSRLALIKRHINSHVKESLRQYFWETVDSNKSIFPSDGSDFSLGYLLLRRIASSLSKENIKNILGDDKIRINKAHPMEFYIYPMLSAEYVSGEILTLDDEIFVILTPSCDFVEDKTGGRLRRVGLVLLAQALPLKCTDEYKKFKSNPEKHKASLQRLIESRKTDRYFFLPGTPFIKNSVIDFQLKTTVPYEELKNFKRVARLDEPFAQAMISSFIRYYNRIGCPDIDSEFILSKL